jgi:hypothetical protein
VKTGCIENTQKKVKVVEFKTNRNANRLAGRKNN